MEITVKTNIIQASVFICVMILGMARAGHAQEGPSAYLSAHNAARAQVNVRPMSWDFALTVYAQIYATQRASNDCRLAHSQGPYGENLLWSLGPAIVPAAAVATWVEEKQWYDYALNTCTGWHQCGHYTQVVWRNSTRLGCARASCKDGAMFVVCNYYPPGNVPGERPY